MSGRNVGIILFFVVALFIADNSLYIMKETERGVLLRFGEVVNTDISPGLHAKVPFVNNVRKFDGRILTVDAQPERFLTQEKKAVIVDKLLLHSAWHHNDFLLGTTSRFDQFTDLYLTWETIRFADSVPLQQIIDGADTAGQWSDGRFHILQHGKIITAVQIGQRRKATIAARVGDQV